jgi:inactivated superfamily I helicase
MFAKLLVIVAAVGATACALLVNRQQRIDTAHEIAAVHQRLLMQEQALWTLRRAMAERVRPDRIRYDVQTLGGAWAAIPSRPTDSAAHRAIRIALLPREPEAIDSERVGSALRTTTLEDELDG